MLHRKFKESPIYSDSQAVHLWVHLLMMANHKDNSLVDYNIINKNTDMAYIVIKLSEDFSLKKGDSLVVALFPESGIQRTIKLEAPLPMKSIVSFE